MSTVGRISNERIQVSTPPQGLLRGRLFRCQRLRIHRSLYHRAAARPDGYGHVTVEAGFTTVADLGSAGYGNLRLRASIDADSAPGPRLIAAGSWMGGRGGVCEFGGATVRGAQEAAARAAADIAAGAALLKLCITNWLDPVVARPDSIELTVDEMRAIMEKARAANVPVVAHAIGQAGVRAALSAGIRWLAHTPVVDDATAADLARERVCISTTMTTLTQGASAAALGASFQRLRSAGARFVLGTDAGVLAHGQNARELITLTELGMAPLDAIRAATITAAECLNLPPDQTSLQPGAPADLVAVRGNPLADIRLLSAPSLVIRKGRRGHPSGERM
ncbi:MAG: amidohydrolase family protein [Longimicrobiales bacterium]